MNDKDRMASLSQILVNFHIEAKKEGTIGHGLECVMNAMRSIDHLFYTRDYADLTSAYLAGVEKGKEQAGAVDDDAVERAARAISHEIHRMADEDVGFTVLEEVSVEQAERLAQAALTAVANAKERTKRR